MMTPIELVKDLEQKLELEPAFHAPVEKYIPALLADLEKHNVVFDENSVIGFASHAMSLVKRLETGEKVKDLGEEVLSQLEEEPLNISREVLLPLEKDYGVTLDHSELALVTIHVQTAMMKMEKAKKSK